MTPAILEKLQAGVKAAMLEKDSLKKDCLRGVISDIKNATVNAGKELTEDMCLKALHKAAKQRNDAIASFRTGKREDLASKELAELKILESYLPKMLSEESVQTLVLKVVNDNKIETSKKNMGQIMKLLGQLPESSLIDKKIASRYLGVLLK